ncbi:hypothetical protein WJX81_005247 [Elliptochloris bilobata]|uniref:Uncharacterized protein n=1 Tax=Elliptochloris bilobata TaxID=381761 RepID=A0AAW1R0G2_9CHLO
MFALRLSGLSTAVEEEAEGKPLAINLMGTPEDILAWPFFQAFLPGVLRYGLLYSANIVSDYMEWVFHPMVGTAGHPGEVDKPADFCFREFMLARSDALFLALAESLVEHAGVVSSQNNTFWRNQRFVHDHYARLQPAAGLPSLSRQS